MTARDFAQTLELCERLGIEHTAIGRHRGERARRQGRRPRLALGGARALGAGERARPAARFDIALGHGSNDVIGRRRAAARSPSSTMFDYEWATVQHNVNCRLARGGRRARRDPARAPGPLRRAGQAAPLRGAEGGVLPGRLRARRGGARRARRSIARARSSSCARRRRSRSTTASRTTCSRAVLDRLRAAAASEGVQPVVLPRVAAAARGARAACPASSCPSARSTRSR